MSIAYGVTWTDQRPIRRLIVLALSVLLLTATLAAASAAGIGPRLPVIVRSAPGAEAAAEQAIVRNGGTVALRLGIVNGFKAFVPSSRLHELAAAPAIVAITPDLPVRMSSVTSGLPYDTSEDGSLSRIAAATGATTAWNKGYTGRGVDIALIDTGVSPAAELAGRVVNGPDLSFDSQEPALRYLDGYGHGTHMAGIIAARPPDLAAGSTPPPNSFAGIAPDARIVNVKVGAFDGATDVSQVLAAIDWIVQHRKSGDLNIRVINMSFGTDGIQDYRLDPLTYAVEVAWQAGIVVVAAAGNAGYGTMHLNNPAHDPFIIAVGADDMRGSVGSGNDIVPAFSSRGKARFPDLVAPGKSVISLRVPGSFIDEAHPAGRIGDKYFRGSGTSQSAAVVSGAVALLLQQRPELTPDQVKYLLRESAAPMPSEGTAAKGEGRMKIDAAIAASTPTGTAHVQTWEPATGLGTLHGARGSLRLVDEGVALDGENDIFGQHFSTAEWAPRSAAHTAWQGGTWMGLELTGEGWCDDSWTARSWTARSWTARSWTARSWTARSWTARSWTGSGWSGDGWTARSWTANHWAGDSWSSAGWGD
ncbi:MAG TPA: S8 family peptidase [Candidatus Limnocylindrales bacterium]|jgi:hypothetical protein|nr:S8 family peptidase [Candidatus Limnocylindrales bacterium]